MFDNYLGINTAGGNGKPKSKFAKRLNIKTKHVKHIRRKAREIVLVYWKKCRLGEKNRNSTFPESSSLVFYTNFSVFEATRGTKLVALYF